jgi:hypothetical protein
LNAIRSGEAGSPFGSEEATMRGQAKITMRLVGTLRLGLFAVATTALPAALHAQVTPIGV